MNGEVSHEERKEAERILKKILEHCGFSTDPKDYPPQEWNTAIKQIQKRVVCYVPGGSGILRVLEYRGKWRIIDGLETLRSIRGKKVKEIIKIN